jgi:hypothetical protein
MVVEDDNEGHADFNVGTEEKRELFQNIRHAGRILKLGFPEHTFRVAAAMLHILTYPL